MALPVINTERISIEYRKRAIDLAGSRVLITNFGGSQQERDLTEPANCKGFGRIRHFQRRSTSTWPANPLPIDPACHSLRLSAGESIRAQVFQNAVCNWRCWYCFVDFELLSANPKHSAWKGADDLIDCYLAQEDRPRIIDLTGGQPDLTPEWVVWMFKALCARGLIDGVYLWSDDNLSNDYFWRFVEQSDQRMLAESAHYGRVCCFKGFSAESFAFNTMAAPSLFDAQFELFQRFAKLGMDAYAYVTLTTPTTGNLKEYMHKFIDRLQAIHPLLPLRTVPLEIRVFTPVASRMDATNQVALVNQSAAVEIWNSEIERRFTPSDRSLPIWDVGTLRRT